MKESSESSVWKRVRQKATGLTRAEPGQRSQQLTDADCLGKFAQADLFAYQKFLTSSSR
jgi:hypothetical protein